MKYTSEQVHKCLVLALVAAVAVLGFSLAYQILQPKGRVSCADFGSYEDADAAFTAGDAWLDGNHNGVPCENLYKVSHPGAKERRRKK